MGLLVTYRGQSRTFYKVRPRFPRCGHLVALVLVRDWPGITCCVQAPVDIRSSLQTGGCFGTNALGPCRQKERAGQRRIECVII